MGKIYTSYFSNLLKLKERGIKPISIALLPPKWYAGEELRDLAPDGTIFIAYKEKLVSEERFQKFYEHKIKEIGKERILAMIEEKANGRDVALICFEHPNDMCHRHILAEYLGIEEFK